VMFLSQVVTIAISAFDFSPHNSYLLSQESEEQKPKESKNAFDYLEESKFLITDFPIVAFFSYVILNTFHKAVVFFEVTNTLDSPPPEIAKVLSKPQL